MIQCFAKTNFKRTFTENSAHKLSYMSKIDKVNSSLPRIMHSHEDILEILFVRNGSGEYIIGTNKYFIEKGDLIICNSNVIHDDVPESNNGLSIYCCAITGVQLDALPSNHLFDNDVYPIFKSLENYYIIKSIMKLMYLQLSSNKVELAESCHNLMTSLLLTTIDIISKGNPLINENNTNQYELCNQIKAYIDKNYIEDISLNSIAESMNVSPFYLSHIFKNGTGFSPMQYTIRRRLGHAQTLLINSTHSITKIASLVGYGNPNYFNIIFSKKIGMSPSQYRKAYVFDGKANY